MMRAKMNVHEIYQYLAFKNFNLTSDRILKEPHLSPDIIWSILVFLISNIKDTKYQQIQPLIFSMLNPEVHKNSSKRIKQYIIISDVLKKISRNNQEYPIKQILKPERQSVLQKISLLICANKFNQKISKDYQNQRTQIKMKKQSVQDLRRKLQSRVQEIEQIKGMKQKQKMQYEEKVQSIQNFTKQLNYKKKQKLDLLNSQQTLDNQLKKKTKALSELGYTNDDLTIKTKQLQRQVIRNAPKLKKQRFSLIQQYQNMVKSTRQQTQIWNKKISILHDKLKSFYGLKEKSKTFKIQQKYKELQQLTNQLNQLKNVVNKDQQHKQQKGNNKKQLMKILQNLQKTKKQVSQNILQQQRQLGLLQKSQKLLRQEQRKHQFNVKILQDKNLLSLSQYKTLEDKIKHRRQKVRQKVFEFSLRLKNLQIQSKQIIEEAFAEFN